MIILSISTVGCIKTTIIKPDENIVRRENNVFVAAAKLKFSYRISNAYLISTKKALEDSFSALGVHDVISSDYILPDRTHVIVYIKNKSTPDFAFPRALISMSTLGMIPFYAETVQPIEIHILDADQPIGEQVTIITTELVRSEFMWLPFAFMRNSESSASYEYANIFSPSALKPYAFNRLEYEGYRRIFDKILLNVIDNKIQSRE